MEPGQEWLCKLSSAVPRRREVYCYKGVRVGGDVEEAYFADR